jgi:hypothetical protein
MSFSLTFSLILETVLGADEGVSCLRAAASASSFFISFQRAFYLLFSGVLVVLRRLTWLVDLFSLVGGYPSNDWRGKKAEKQWKRRISHKTLRTKQRSNRN